MLQTLWLVPILPFAGFLILLLFGARMSRRVVAWIGAGTVGLSALIALAIGLAFISAPPVGHAFSQTLWIWMRVGNFAPGITFYLDALSLVMILVVSWVGFLISVYSSAFMRDDEDFSRFFAYMHLFISSMLVLVLADNLLLLYLGWEGVGLCSYLLIGFWYKDPVNGWAANKAFIITRIGDTALSIALFLIFATLGTLQIQQAMQRASMTWPVGAGVATAIAALLLGGAVGKSAQLPLQTWLPDAMAGPTPVSALIHAATMVTAGVYLIARTHVFFALAPTVQLLVAIIGVLTMLLAAFSALTQHDVKRVLAYSTMSQIGYMFLALGVGAWSAAIFHFMTHAFFKALLFLAAGVVILNLHDEHDMYKMGGLRKRLPVAYWSFLIGCLSLSALPLVTAGFYSKDAILYDVWSAAHGSAILWAAGVLGAFLTAVYAFRMVFLIFYGKENTRPLGRGSLAMTIPLVSLSVLAIIAGFVQTPPELGNLHAFASFLQTALPPLVTRPVSALIEFNLLIDTPLAALAGIYVAYLLFLRRARLLTWWTHSFFGQRADQFLLVGWGFDWLYDRLIVQPYVWLSWTNSKDIIDLFYSGLAWSAKLSNRALSATQSGKVRWYAAGIALGAVIVIAIMVFI
jgi:NADH-quinone oxidoreductase subunit L